MKKHDEICSTGTASTSQLNIQPILTGNTIAAASILQPLNTFGTLLSSSSLDSLSLPNSSSVDTAPNSSNLHHSTASLLDSFPLNPISSSAFSLINDDSLDASSSLIDDSINDTLDHSFITDSMIDDSSLISNSLIESDSINEESSIFSEVHNPVAETTSAESVATESALQSELAHMDTSVDQ